MNGHRFQSTVARCALFAFAFLAVTGLFASVLALQADAQQQVELQGKVRRGQEVVVPAGETVNGDLIAMGGQIRIEGRVLGDLVAFGSQIDVDGDVLGDVLAAGGRVRLAGTIGGDLRVAAGQLALSGPVREDVLATAGEFALTSRATVQDLIFAAGQTRVDGTVAGNVLGVTGSYARTGSVSGTEKVSVNQRRQRARPTVARRVLNAIRRYIAIIAFGLLLLLLAPRFLQSATAAARERPAASFGIGILAFVAFFVAVFVIVLATGIVAALLGLLGFRGVAGLAVFGSVLAIAALVFAFLVAVLYLAYIVVGLVIGRLLLRGSAPVTRPLAALLVGVLVLVVLRTIPVLGSAVAIVAVPLGLGALFLLLWPRRTPEPPAPPPPVPAV